MKLDVVLLQQLMECIRRGVQFRCTSGYFTAQPPPYTEVVYLSPWLTEQPPEALTAMTLDQLYEFGATRERTERNTRTFGYCLFDGHTVVSVPTWDVEVEKLLSMYLRYLPPRTPAAEADDPPTFYTLPCLRQMKDWVDNGWTVRMHPDNMIEVEVQAICIRGLPPLELNMRRNVSDIDEDLVVETYYMRDGTAPQSEDRCMFRADKHTPARDLWLRDKVRVRYAMILAGAAAVLEPDPDVSFLGYVVDAARNGYIVNGKFPMNVWMNQQS